MNEKKKEYLLKLNYMFQKNLKELKKLKVKWEQFFQ